ncbi:MAG: hypothetical protein HZB13_16300 [Acidobacteria bacterium]|nr:hypothetical protein [Acidobacteriota bacterium]
MVELPPAGSLVAVQCARNPSVYSDPALQPRLYFGRVVRHEGSWGFTAALMNYDNAPQETWLEWDEEKQEWEDRDFRQPVLSVTFPLSPDLAALAAELESLPQELPTADGPTRPFDELRLRFLAGAFESGWLDNPREPIVYYSDDFALVESTVSRWHTQPLGRVEVSPDRIFFEWPVDGKTPEECGIELLRQDDGTFYMKSEEFGDEFQARLELRAGYHLVAGLWGSDEFLSFFGAVLPA